jgi:hypothetical protein
MSEQTQEVTEVKLQFSPALFDPNKEQLHEIAKQVQSITADPEKITKEELALVNETKNKLVKARTAIQRAGKAAREEAVKYQKDVIAYEKELIAIIEPEEQRIKEIESAAKEYAMKQERLKSLPEFKQKLADIGDGIEADDEFLLSLDPNQRDSYYVQRLTAKVEADAAAIKAQQEQEAAAKEQARLAAEAAEAQARKDKIAARREILIEIGFKPILNREGLYLITIDGTIEVGDQMIFEMTESIFATESNKWRQLADAKKAADLAKAQEEAAMKAQEEEKQRAAAEEAKRRADEEAAKKAQEEAALKAQEEEKARQSTEAYQNWLSSNSYNAETDLIQEQNGQYVLYRKISSLELNAFAFKAAE